MAHQRRHGAALYDYVHHLLVFRELGEDAGGALGGGAVGVAPREAVVEGVDLRADLAGDRLLGVAAGDLRADGALFILVVLDRKSVV